jgi:hypothetical protein
MDRARHFALVFLFILSLIAPAMTCALPDAGMTMQERACCRDMKGHCAREGMPASHSCCRQTVANRFDAVQPHAVSVPALAVVAILPSPSYFDLRSFIYGRVSFPSQIPAASPPSAISVLRV